MRTHDVGKSLMGLTISRGCFSALERCQQGQGWSLVPGWDLSRCCTVPVISCTGTCWQMRVWSSLSHDPSWDVSQHLVQLFSYLSAFAHPHHIQCWSLQGIVVVEPFAAQLCVWTAMPRIKHTLLPCHSRFSMACPTLSLHHSSNAYRFTISWQFQLNGKSKSLPESYSPEETTCFSFFF